MPIQPFTARLSEARMLTEKIWLGKFELVQPNKIDFLAGQYLLLDVPGTPQKRSYSIASSPDMTTGVEVMVDLSPHGPGTQYLEGLKAGEEVKFYAPAGEFVQPGEETQIRKEEERLVFVATGTGLAPLRSMYLDLLQTKQDKRPMKVFWGLRNELDICFLEELRELASAFPYFSFEIVLSQASPEWTLKTGHVTKHVLADMTERTGYYLCGNPHMIVDVNKALLEKGVQSQHIHMEKFFSEVK